MKKLTDKGIEEVEGIDEVVDRDFSSKKPEPRTYRENNPQNKSSKTFLYIYLISIAFLIIGLLATYVIWYNISFSKKDFAPIVNVENKVETPKVDVNVNSSANINNDYEIKLNATININEVIVGNSS